MRIGRDMRFTNFIIVSVLVFALTTSVSGYQSGVISLIVLLGLSSMLPSWLDKTADFLRPQVLMPFAFMLYALRPLFLWWRFYSYPMWTDYFLLMLTGLIALRIGLHVGGKGAQVRTLMKVQDLQKVPVVGQVAYGSALTTAFSIGLLSVFMYIVARTSVLGDGFKGQPA